MLDVRFFAALLTLFQLSLAREVPWPVKFWLRTSPGFPLLHWAAFNFQLLLCLDV